MPIYSSFLEREITMKIRLCVISIILLLSSFSSIALYANQDSTNHVRLVEEVYIKSGLAKQIPAIQSQLNIFIKAYQAKLLPEDFKVFFKELDAIFNPVILEARIKQYLSSDLTDAELTHMLDWYNSAFGGKITLLEEQSSTPEKTKELISFIQQNDIGLLTHNRLNLVKRLDLATGCNRYCN